VPQPELLGRFAIALLVGVLIGMEREHTRLEEEVKAFAGVRTFPLIGLLGCAAALLSDQTAGLAFSIVLLLVGALISIAYAFTAREGHVGLTSEMAAAVVFVCGALAYWDHLELSAAIAVATFGFLTLKPQLHGIVHREGPPEAHGHGFGLGPSQAQQILLVGTGESFAVTGIPGPEGEQDFLAKGKIRAKALKGDGYVRAVGINQNGVRHPEDGPERIHDDGQGVGHAAIIGHGRHKGLPLFQGPIRSLEGDLRWERIGDRIVGRLDIGQARII